MSFDVSNLRSSGMKCLEKSVYLENQNRTNNLRVEGITEEPSETWDRTEQKVKHVLVDKLNLKSAPGIERAHRTGKNKKYDGNPKPRMVVLRLYDW